MFGLIVTTSQADLLQTEVVRPHVTETTALGAAFLAGLAEGVWPDLQAIQATWQLDATFDPEPDRTFTDLLHQQWQLVPHLFQHK